MPAAAMTSRASSEMCSKMVARTLSSRLKPFTTTTSAAAMLRMSPVETLKVCTSAPGGITATTSASSPPTCSAKCARMPVDVTTAMGSASATGAALVSSTLSSAPPHAMSATAVRSAMGAPRRRQSTRGMGHPSELGWSDRQR